MPGNLRPSSWVWSPWTRLLKSRYRTTKARHDCKTVFGDFHGCDDRSFYYRVNLNDLFSNQLDNTRYTACLSHASCYTHGTRVHMAVPLLSHICARSLAPPTQTPKRICPAYYNISISWTTHLLWNSTSSFMTTNMWADFWGFRRRS